MLKSRVALCAAALLFSITLTAQGANRKLVPGEYETEGGWGNLVLKQGKGGVLFFSIESVGANGHSCSVEGELHNGKATLEGSSEDEPCLVTLVPLAEGIEVQADSCRDYCGARAGFDGTYLPLPPACTAKAIAATRKTFKQLYDARKFTAARAKLEPLLTVCERSLDPWTDGWIRNDVAVTLHKLGDLAGCRAVLEPWVEEAERTDDELAQNLPPADAEMRAPIVRATRTNLRLCRKK